MSRFFTRERFGRPQFVAGLLLLLFLSQCVWLVSIKAKQSALDSEEMARLMTGLDLWSGQKAGYTRYEPGPPETEEAQASDPDHSRLWYLIAAAPLLVVRPGVFPAAPDVWLSSIPYLLFGVLLGASLWYVARRLYGNAGGYIALTLYCFAPGIIRACALWQARPESGAAWGAFGTVFTAIAVAHTLYAPREVIIWNWRRILLLGLSLALAVGSQFSLVILIPLALAFMLYVAPERRGAAVAIWAAGWGVGLILLLAAYSFQPMALWEGLRHASFLGYSAKTLAMAGAYREVGARLNQSSLALVVALPVTLVVYFFWSRARYFGNTAPLLVAALFLFLGLLTPHYPGLGFQLLALPFLFVFVAGVFADLLETRYRILTLACLWVLLGAYALRGVVQLAELA